MMKRRTKKQKEWDNQSDYYDRVKILCSCGHKNVIPVWVDRNVCSWCGKYVYRNKRLEFEEKLKQALK